MRLRQGLKSFFSQEKSQSHNKLKEKPPSWVALACVAALGSGISLAILKDYENVRVNVDSPISSFQIELTKRSDF